MSRVSDAFPSISRCNWASSIWSRVRCWSAIVQFFQEIARKQAETGCRVGESNENVHCWRTHVSGHTPTLPRQILAGCDILLHGVALLCGFGTASLPAQGGQQPPHFNKLRVIFGIGLIGFIGTKGADEPYEPYARCHPIHGCAENMAINTAIITTPEAAVKAKAEVKRKRSVAKAR